MTYVHSFHSAMILAQPQVPQQQLSTLPCLVPIIPQLPEVAGTVF